jgi:hypothetical protein
MATRTVRTCAESVRVPDFLRDLLAKPARFTREPTCNGCRPPLYRDEGSQSIEPLHSIQSTLLIVFTLCNKSSPSLAFLYLKSLHPFDSTLTRGVLGGLPTPRHTIGSLIRDGVPPERRDLGLLQRRRRRPSAPPRTVRASGADRLDVRREGAAPTLRSRIVRPRATDRPRLCREHRQVVHSCVWRPDRRQ